MGCMHAFWMWVPILIFKAIAAICRCLWTFVLWILQTISGVPLYYCKPEFLIPAKIIGTIGILLLTGVVFIISLSSGIDTDSQNNNSILWTIFMNSAISFLLLWGSRILIRKGAE
jgi:hypothetical protein